MKYFLILFSFLFYLTSCSNQITLYSDQYFIMDTLFQVSFYSDYNYNEKKSMSQTVYQILYHLETNYSVTIENSFIANLNNNFHTEINPEQYIILSNALTFCHWTGGVFDISIFPVITEWGFTDRNFKIPDTNQIHSALRKVGYENIILTPHSVSLTNQTQIDLGGILKGYAVDQVVEFLESKEIIAGIVDAGGNLKCFGKKPDGSPWRVGIRHPRKENEIIFAFTSSNDIAIATSGDYQRYFITNGVKYHHIISPFTGFPVDNQMTSVSVLHQSAETCDALATALFVMGLNDGMRFCISNQIAALFVYESGNDVILSNSPQWNQTISGVIDLDEL